MTQRADYCLRRKSILVRRKYDRQIVRRENRSLDQSEFFLFLIKTDEHIILSIITFFRRLLMINDRIFSDVKRARSL